MSDPIEHVADRDEFLRQYPPHKRVDPRVVAKAELVSFPHRATMMGSSYLAAVDQGAEAAMEEAKTEVFVDPSVSEPSQVWYFDVDRQEFCTHHVADTLEVTMAETVRIAAERQAERVIVDEVGVGLPLLMRLVEDAGTVGQRRRPWLVQPLGRMVAR